MKGESCCMHVAKLLVNVQLDVVLTLVTEEREVKVSSIRWHLTTRALSQRVVSWRGSVKSLHSNGVGMHICLILKSHAVIDDLPHFARLWFRILLGRRSGSAIVTP